MNARAPFRVATPMWHTEGESNSLTCPTPRVSGLVSAPDESAEQECNRPDQLRQCRYHCYSDLGFLLPIQTQPPHSRRPMAFRHHPVTSSRRCQLPGRNTAGPGSTPRRPPILSRTHINSTDAAFHCWHILPIEVLRWKARCLETKPTVVPWGSCPRQAAYSCAHASFLPE